MTPTRVSVSVERVAAGRVPSTLVLLVGLLTIVFAGACKDIAPPGAAPTQPSDSGAAPPPASTPRPAATPAPGQPTPPSGATFAPTNGATEPNLRVAFFGDQGINNNSRAVLELVRGEGAQTLIILGDFDYDDDPDGWDTMLTQKLGADFPVFAAIGNHDTARWTDYQRKLTDRLARIQGATCTGDYGVNSACTYRGLFFILSGVGTRGRDHTAFLRSSLAQDSSIWSVCAWHKNQTALQLGDKDNDVGWEPYEECRKAGAIVATGHEHTYSRTKTLSNVQSQTVDSQWGAPDQLRVGGGSTFVFVSGLGGQSIRDQERCRPTSPPFGCKGEWASVYASNQGAKYGALFIDFGVDGDPRKARGYFKNIAGEVIDSFTIVSEPSS